MFRGIVENKILYLESSAIILTEFGTCDDNLFDPIKYTEVPISDSYSGFPLFSNYFLIYPLKPKYDTRTKKLRMKLLVTPPMNF